jgi:hypothetical protein
MNHQAVIRNFYRQMKEGRHFPLIDLLRYEHSLKALWNKYGDKAGEKEILSLGKAVLEDAFPRTPKQQYRDRLFFAGLNQVKKIRAYWQEANEYV